MHLSLTLHLVHVIHVGSWISSSCMWGSAAYIWLHFMCAAFWVNWSMAYSLWLHGVSIWRSRCGGIALVHCTSLMVSKSTLNKEGHNTLRRCVTEMLTHICERILDGERAASRWSLISVWSAKTYSSHFWQSQKHILPECIHKWHLSAVDLGSTLVAPTKPYWSVLSSCPTLHCKTIQLHSHNNSIQPISLSS